MEHLLPDAELLRQSALDPAAFGALYERHGLAVRRFVVRRVGIDDGEDTTTHTTAAVTRDGYFLLVEPDRPIDAGNGSGETQLRVLNAAGQPLQPDYTSGKLVPGHTLGPTSG